MGEMTKRRLFLEMEHLPPENDGEIGLFSTILKLSLGRGWLTEDEKLRIESKTTLSEKKSQFFDVLKSMECQENAISLLCAIRSMNVVESLYKGKGNDEDEYHFSTSKLFEESLLDQGKKLPLDTIKKEQDSKADVSEHVTKAMLLGPVIRSVLQYLNLKDVKKCRHISKEWRSVAEPIFRTRSKIKFSNDTYLIAPMFHPSEFRKQFASTLEIIPFTAFSFSCEDYSIYAPWALNELNDFFQNEGGNIRELEISFFAHKDGKLVKSLDITPWIATSPITRTNTKYHTKLSTSGPRGTCLLIIQNFILANVKELLLDHCQIILKSSQDEQIKIQPIKLTLSDVSFIRDGKMLEKIFLNDIVDFSRVKHMALDITGRYPYHENTNPSLSLKGNDNLHLNYLRLNCVTVTNWRKCTWTVDKLEMRVPSFVKKTKMKIRELDLRFPTILDLSVLPQSLNKLTIYSCTIKNCFSSQNVILNNLHYLKLSDYGYNDDLLLCISKFVECPNLIYLHLECVVSTHRQLNYELNSDWIPRSVKKIKLDCVTIKWGEGCKDFNLDKLVLSDYFFRSVKKIDNILNQTKELVLLSHRFAVDSESVDNLLEYLRLMNCSDYLQRIYVGPFNWPQGYSLKESALVDHVDMEGKYYLFENQVGKSLDISAIEFDEFSNIEPITSSKGKLEDK